MVRVMPILIGALGTDIKRMGTKQEDLEITGQLEIIRTTALLRLAIILRIVLET